MNASRGMGLVDAAVGSALVLIVFVALLGLLRTSLLVSSAAKLKAGATAVGTTQMEYIRSLSYDTVGTVGGIPAGPVAQYATTTMNGIPYVVRTLVQYVDDPKDGLGSSDSNSITTDYKRVRVTVTYLFREEEREVAIVSNVVPPSIESTTGGGTLRINVVNAPGLAVAGASVRVVNPSLSPTVDVTTFTNIDGAALFPGAPTSTDYQITVTKDGYSTANTYDQDSENQSPTPGHLTVAVNQTTASTFAIDLLSTFSIATFFPVSATSTADTFDSAARVTNMTNVVLQGGAVTLVQDMLAAYITPGSFRSTLITHPYLVTWENISFASALPSGTAARVRVLDEGGAVIPDSLLPGNGAGFTSSPISLTGLSTTTYPSLILAGELSTQVPSVAPQLLDWTVNATAGPIPAPNVPFTITGDKKRGSTGGGSAIFKTTISSTTDALGVWTLPVEWDVYTLVLSGFDLIDPPGPATFTLEPGSTTEAVLIVE